MEIVRITLMNVEDKNPYLIDGAHLKNGKYRELITFKDGTKVRLIYG